MYGYTLYLHELMQAQRQGEFERAAARQRQLRQAHAVVPAARRAPRWAQLLTLLFAW